MMTINGSVLLSKYLIKQNNEKWIPFFSHIRQSSINFHGWICISPSFFFEYYKNSKGVRVKISINLKACWETLKPRYYSYKTQRH